MLRRGVRSVRIRVSVAVRCSAAHSVCAWCDENPIVWVRCSATHSLHACWGEIPIACVRCSAMHSVCACCDGILFACWLMLRCAWCWCAAQPRRKPRSWTGSSQLAGRSRHVRVTCGRVVSLRHSVCAAAPCRASGVHGSAVTYGRGCCLPLSWQRKWSEFVENFSLPKGWSEVEERAFTNLLYYRTNYLLIAVVIFAWWLYVRIGGGKWGV